MHASLQFVNPSRLPNIKWGKNAASFSLFEDRGLRAKPDTGAQLFKMEYPKTKQKKNAAWHQDTNISIVYVIGAGSVSMVWTSVGGLKPFHSVSSTIVESFSGKIVQH